MRPVLLLLMLVAGPAFADAPGPAFGSPSHFTEADGAAIYAGVCAGCHMPDGRGAVGAGAYPSLAGDHRLAAAGYPLQIVLHGRGAMPPLGRYLTDAQAAAVVDYIRTHFGNSYAPAPTAAAAAAQR